MEQKYIEIFPVHGNSIFPGIGAGFGYGERGRGGISPSFRIFRSANSNNNMISTVQNVFSRINKTLRLDDMLKKRTAYTRWK